MTPDSIRENPPQPANTSNQWTKVVISLGIVGILIVGGLFFQRGCEKVIDKGTKAGPILLDKTLAIMEKHFGAKNAFQSSMGEMTIELTSMKLQFVEQDKICFFRIVRYRGSYNPAEEPKNVIESYRMESEKSKPTVIAGQYTEWEAKGCFNFIYYVDMSKPDQWDVQWDRNTRTLNITAPPIGANLPAEIESLKYTKVASCVTIRGDYTKQLLENEVPKLKKEIADRGKDYPSTRSLARDQIRVFFKEWISKLFTRENTPEIPYEIKVRFNDEIPPVSSKL